MKTSGVLFILVAVFALQNCSREEEDLRPGKIQFVIGLTSGNDPGARKATELPVGSSIRLTIETLSGDNVYRMHPVALYKVGDHFISEPVPLSWRTYRLTDFLIASQANEVLFAAPKAGSPMASLVDRPLPLTFSVQNNSTTNLDIQVVDVTDSAPEDFGYVSFDVEVVTPTFDLAVFSVDEEGASLTTAEAFFVQGNDTLPTHFLQPAINRIPYLENREEPFTLVVIKDGYGMFHQTFDSFTDFLGLLGGDPLEVTLQPAFTFGFVIEEGWDEVLAMTLKVNGTVDLMIDWGDGTAPEQFTVQDEVNLGHPANAGQKYFISISGDLSKITGVGTFPAGQILSRLNVSHLARLKEIDIIMGRTPETIDLSDNPDLEFVNLNNTSITHLDVSHNPKLLFLNLDGTEFTTDAVDKLIDGIYQNVVTHGLKNGFLGLTIDAYGIGVGIIGPPSPDGMEKLLELKGVYGWTVPGFSELTINSLIDPVNNPELKWEISFRIESGLPASFSIIWGDETPVQSVVIGQEHASIQHTYVSSGMPVISIMGDLDKIHGISPESCTIIDLSRLSGLKYYESKNTGSSPDVISFTDNPRIEVINLRGTSTRAIIIARHINKEVRYVNLAGTSFTTATLDDLIDPLYNIAVEANRENGTFIFTNGLNGEPESGLIATPSPAGLQMLRSLRDYYAWHVPGL